MNEFKTINAVLDFAIGKEQEAIDFYNNMAEKLSNKAMKEAFEQFAREEMGHKAKLFDIQQKGIFSVSAEAITDLKIADFIVAGSPSQDMTYQDALILAMNAEKAAFRLYSALAEKAPYAELKSTFLMLAQEEAKHKLRFEIEYDEYVLREN